MYEKAENTSKRLTNMLIVRETTVAELHKYKIMLKDNGSWMPAYACNKQQKELLSCFGLSQEVLEKQVRSIKLRV